MSAPALVLEAGGPPAAVARNAWAPVLLGALVGSLVAGRFETALRHALSSLVAGDRARARRGLARGPLAC